MSFLAVTIRVNIKAALAVAIRAADNHDFDPKRCRYATLGHIV